MPYYQAGDYYQGDYYQAGGIFSGIGKVLGGVAKTAFNLTPIGRAISTVAPVVKQLVAPSVRPRPTGLMIAPPTPLTLPVENKPGIIGAAERFFPGGGTGLQVAVPMMGFGGRNGGRPGHFKKDGTWTDRARPRMQVTNTRALKRAGRRVRGFLRIARQLGALPVGTGKGKKLFKRRRR